MSTARARRRRTRDATARRLEHRRRRGDSTAVDLRRASSSWARAAARIVRIGMRGPQRAAHRRSTAKIAWVPERGSLSLAFVLVAAGRLAPGGVTVGIGGVPFFVGEARASTNVRTRSPASGATARRRRDPLVDAVLARSGSAFPPTTETPRSTSRAEKWAPRGESLPPAGGRSRSAGRLLAVALVALFDRELLQPFDHRALLVSQ